MDLYDSWQTAQKVSGHQITAILDSYHSGQITGAEAAAIMNHWGLDAEAQNEMTALYNKLVAGNISRGDLNNALILGGSSDPVPGFQNKAEFKAKLGL